MIGACTRGSLGHVGSEAGSKSDIYRSTKRGNPSRGGCCKGAGGCCRVCNLLEKRVVSEVEGCCKGGVVVEGGVIGYVLYIKHV